jgi:NTP pyrophosphatase (non-canonical NTP hydrolase)
MSELRLNEYQALAMRTAKGLATGYLGAVYNSLALCGEAGEVAEIVKKRWQNHGVSSGKQYAEGDKLRLAYELGDVLWYLSVLANDIGCPLSRIADLNLEKLADRERRDVICGEGDDR